VWLKLDITGDITFVTPRMVRGEPLRQHDVVARYAGKMNTMPQVHVVAGLYRRSSITTSPVSERAVTTAAAFSRLAVCGTRTAVEPSPVLAFTK
jgi:hypothetical protein